jgi:hypothetical protein
VGRIGRYKGNTKTGRNKQLSYGSHQSQFTNQVALLTNHQ